MVETEKRGERGKPDKKKAELKDISRWEDFLLGVPLRSAHVLIPGLSLAVLLWLAAEWLSGFIGLDLMGLGTSPVSAIMLAILLGMILRNSIKLPDFFELGIRFTLAKVLRFGIILLGMRLSLFAAMKIGLWGIPVIAACILSGLVVTTLVARRIGLSHRLGTLIAVGTSICGASAIVATGPIIKAKEEEVTYAVACITIFGIAAMFVYPLLAPSLFSGDTQIGLFLGTSIHETAQVAGSGLIFDQLNPGASPPVADVSITTKLVRNIFMSLVIPIMAILYARREARMAADARRMERKVGVSPLSVFPLFILGFIAAIVIRTAGDAGLTGGGLALGLLDESGWNELVGFAAMAAKSMLAIAMAGVGLGCDFGKLRRLGLKPFMVGIAAAIVVGVTSLLVINLMGNLMTIS